MKATKILVMLLALVLMFALVACGGEKEPEVTDDAAVTTTTAAAATTTKTAATTTKAATTTAAPAVTTAAPVVTTTATPKEVTNTPEEYKSLYVTDGNVFHLNFAYATPDSPSIVGSSKYEDENASAHNRFQGASSNYTDYLFNSMVVNPVSGGTAKILTPWFFEDWYADWTVTMGSGKVADMRTAEPEDYVSTTDYEGTVVYIVNTNVTETDFYIQDGRWAKKTYASTWGNGYLNLGANSALNFYNGYKLITESSFTIQFVASMTDTRGYLSAYLGARVKLTNASEGGIGIEYNNKYFVAEDSENKFENLVIGGDSGLSLNGVNAYTFTFDRSDVFDGDDTTKNAIVGAYINDVKGAEQTVKEGKLDITNKIFESANSDVYSIRLYNRVLTDAEVAQNYFADLAIILQLDITEYLTLDDAAKATVHTALGKYTIDIPFAIVQKALDEAVAAAK